MIVAVDKVTGRVLGQVLTDWIALPIPWGDGSWVAKDHRYVRLLSGVGEKTVLANSVRLEKV